MPDVTRCPSCGRPLRVPEQLFGELVQCPSCAYTFTATPAGSDPPAPAVPAPEPAPELREHVTQTPELSLPRSAPEEKERWRPPPEEDDDYPPPRRARVGMADISAEYRINLTEWFNHANAHYGAVLGPMIGYLLLYALMNVGLGAIPLLGQLVALFLMPPLQAGFTAVCLAQLKGERWDFGTFFSGFDRYGDLLGNFFLILLIFAGTAIPSVVVVAVVTNTVPYSDEALLALLSFVAFNGCLSIYLVLRVSCFSVPLILDRRVGAVEAIRGSWELSRGHFWGLFGVALLLMLLVGAGVMLCLVGVLFTAPLALLTWTAGYLLIAGTRPPRPAPYSRAPRWKEDDVGPVRIPRI
jgi:hypothetical protein